MQSLQEWKKDTESSLGLRLEKKYNKMEYKLGSKIISQFEEYAKFKKEIRLERSRVRKVEAENAQIKMEIKVTSVRVLILATYPCFLI